MRIIIIFTGIIWATSSFANDINMPRDQWLSNLGKIMPVHLCKAGSPFLKVYKGENCQKDINLLYKKCTTDVDNVKIPETITSIQHANKLGQILAECTSAHYMGGAVLDAFNKIQSRENAKK